MRVQAIAKCGGLWVPWHSNLLEGSTIELDVDEVMPSSEVVKSELNSTRILPVIHNKSTTTLPDDEVAEFMRLTDDLFEEGFCYVLE